LTSLTRGDAQHQISLPLDLPRILRGPPHNLDTLAAPGRFRFDKVSQLDFH